MDYYYSFIQKDLFGYCWIVYGVYAIIQVNRFRATAEIRRIKIAISDEIKTFFDSPAYYFIFV